MSPMHTPLSPSLHTIRPHDRPLLACELRIAAVREQAAIVRAFLDEVERLIPRSAAQGAATAQVVEELAGLGQRILEAADVMARAFGVEPARRTASLSGMRHTLQGAEAAPGAELPEAELIEGGSSAQDRHATV